jgi:hypothetical protein
MDLLKMDVVKLDWLKLDLLKLDCLKSDLLKLDLVKFDLLIIGFVHIGFVTRSRMKPGEERELRPIGYEECEKAAAKHEPTRMERMGADQVSPFPPSQSLDLSPLFSPQVASILKGPAVPDHIRQAADVEPEAGAELDRKKLVFKGHAASAGAPPLLLAEKAALGTVYETEDLLNAEEYNDEEKKRKRGDRGANRKKKKREEEEASNYKVGEDRQYDVWMPPADQKGDGKTSLNAKLGY